MLAEYPLALCCMSSPTSASCASCDHSSLRSSPSSAQRYALVGWFVCDTITPQHDGYFTNVDKHYTAIRCSSLPQSLNADAVQRFGRNRFEQVLREIQLRPDVGVEREEVRHSAQTKERADDRRLCIVVTVTQQVAAGRYTRAVARLRCRTHLQYIHIIYIGWQ